MNKPTLNIIPLIDVMLVIIIISLSAQSFIKFKAINVTPPISKSENKVANNANVLSISKDFEIKLNDEMITLENLAQSINKEEKLNIICDEELYFKDFIKVIYELKSHDINNYSILTRLK